VQTLRRLALRLGVDAGYVAEEVEPDLVFAGLVSAGDGPRRALTPIVFGPRIAIRPIIADTKSRTK
jgi:hypothetical protein